MSPHLPERYQDLFAAALARLPVPVVGLPWGQARHVPSLVAVAHEVGHCVEEDFGLAPFLTGRLRDADLERPDAWIAWSGELFADLWGLLGGGRAYAAMLAGALAGPVGAIRSERREAPAWTDYPTASLRIAAVFTMAEAIGVDAGPVAKAWRATYDDDAAVAPWRDDLERVVAAWIGAPCPAFGGRALEDVLRPPDPEIGLADDLAAGVPLAASDADARRLVVACGEALWTSPGTYPADEPALLREFARLRKRGVRAGRDPGAIDVARDHDAETARALALDFLNHLEDA